MRSADKATIADPSTRRMLLSIPHPGARNHNGGQLQFGPDKRLYISTGDGGTAPPRGDNARRLDSLLGKILRINPLPTDTTPYRIPSSNPFVDTPGALGEIFAYGLRHPWRFSFDGTRIIIGDVGENIQEEVNFLEKNDAAGTNFGWPQYEGNLVFDDTRPGPDEPVFPIFTYNATRGTGLCAIIGGYVVRDPELPALNGRYVYGDACSGEVRSFLPDVATQQATDDRPTGVVLPGLSSFGLGYKNKIYAAQISGEVSRLDPPSP
jgi:glucose/arabinose dehydrogenase